MPVATRDFSWASGTYPRKPGWLNPVYHASAFWRPLPEIAPGHPFENRTNDSKLATLIHAHTKLPVANILRFIRCVVDVPDEYAVLLSAFVLYTWVADRLPTAVYLSVIGLSQSGKGTPRELLSLLCRREQQRQRRTRSFPEEVNVVNMVNVPEGVMSYVSAGTNCKASVEWRGR
jgi:hypothetical protein